MCTSCSIFRSKTVRFLLFGRNLGPTRFQSNWFRDLVNPAVVGWIWQAHATAPSKTAAPSAQTQIVLAAMSETQTILSDIVQRLDAVAKELSTITATVGSLDTAQKGIQTQLDLQSQALEQQVASLTSLEQRHHHVAKQTTEMELALSRLNSGKQTVMVEGPGSDQEQAPRAEQHVHRPFDRSPTWHTWRPRRSATCVGRLCAA